MLMSPCRNCDDDVPLSRTHLFCRRPLVPGLCETCVGVEPRLQPEHDTHATAEVLLTWKDQLAGAGAGAGAGAVAVAVAAADHVRTARLRAFDIGDTQVHGSLQGDRRLGMDEGCRAHQGQQYEHSFHGSLSPIFKAGAQHSSTALGSPRRSP